MKRFSKSHHTTLSEINITPLLDLAFVLLVIFVIATTPLVHDVDLRLPVSSSKPKDSPKKPNYISVDNQGHIFLNMEPIELGQLLDRIIDLRTKNPDLSVILRGDGKIAYRYVVNVIEILQQANVVKLSLATDPIVAVK